MSVQEGVHSYWTEQPVENILSGLKIDNDILARYLPPQQVNSRRISRYHYEVIDLGAGNGTFESQLKSLDRSAYSITALDINPIAVSSLKSQDIKAGIGDVTRWSEGLGTESIIKLEHFDAVVSQAVTPSLLGDGGREWQHMFDAMDMWLKPTGLFIFSDFRAADMYYAPLVKQIGSLTAQYMMIAWDKRYRTNQEAFQSLNLPYRAFAVGKPGTEGKHLENGSVNDLKRLYGEKNLFERFAQHIDPVSVDHYLRGVLGYTLLEQRFSFYQSRGSHGLIAPTVLQVWKKSPYYKYGHNTRGLRYGDPLTNATSIRRMADFAYEASQNDIDGYYVLAIARILRYAPESQVIPLYRLMKEFAKWERPDMDYLQYLIMKDT